MSKRFLTATMTAVVSLCVGSFARAQDIDLTRGDADLTFHGIEGNATAGIWLDRGALNKGDGRRDLVIGAPGGPGLAGHVYVINGGPVKTGDLSLSTADTIITGTELGDKFGAAGAVGNILNTEGTNPRNLIVGAPAAMGGRGVVYLFAANFQPTTRITTANATFKIVGGPGDQLGAAIVTADLNGDGYREIIMGAPGTDRIYIVRGGPGLTGTRNLETQGADLLFGGPGFGEAIAAGDVTGDGLYDLVVGSVSTNTVYLYRGQPSGVLTFLPDATFNFPGATDDKIGSMVQVADIDGDDIRDIIIGAPGADGPGGSRADAGAVYVMWGSAAIASRNLALADATFYGDAPGQQLGAFIGTGNINRDAVDDLAILAGGAGNGAGVLTMYYGRDRSGFGFNAGDGRRIIDLATPSNVDRKILGLGNPSLGAIRTAQVFELTGEGAGDVIAGIPGASGAAGVVYFTVSPKFVLSNDTVTLRINDNTVVTTSLEVRNPSIVNVTWTATGNQPWMSVQTPNGTTDRSAPGPLTFNVNSAGMALGTYTGTVTVRSTSKHLDMLLRVTVTVQRVPLDPPGFVTVIPATHGVTLQWAAVAGARTYTIRRIAASGASTVIATGLNSTTFTDANAPAGQTARYVVTSVNSAGESVSSSPVWMPWGAAGSRTPTVLTPIDYDGDGKADATVYRSSTGEWFTRKSSNGATLSRGWGAPSLQDQPVPGDYDGDGKGDVAIYRQSSGQWFIARSSDGGMTQMTWGAPSFGDLPVPADYDGDGRTDIAIYRGTSGEWFILRSSNQTLLQVTWGAPSLGDLPVPADYDGDGKADIGVYRNSSGDWYVRRTSNGALIQRNWGNPSFGDVPVPADYDGDNKADMAIYRATTGDWYVSQSTGATLHVGWGSPGLSDVPVAADYDGDGKADIGVYRFSTGDWFIRRTSNGALIQMQWGGPTFGDSVRAF